MNDGGPAFPIFSDSVPHGGNAAWGGMTLRDYMAAKAMQAELIQNNSVEDEKIAKWAYAMADAMLKERETK